MDALQNVTNQQPPTDDKLNDLILEDYISFTAVGGLITEDDGQLKKMSITEFAASHNISRMTLDRWKKTTPNFWDRVDKRRREIFTKNRITAVWNGLFLRAAKGDAEQAKIILGEYAKWQPPAQRHDVTVGGLSDLVNIARQKQIIEGEVVDGHNT